MSDFNTRFAQLCEAHDSREWYVEADCLVRDGYHATPLADTLPSSATVDEAKAHHERAKRIANSIVLAHNLIPAIKEEMERLQQAVKNRESAWKNVSDLATAYKDERDDLAAELSTKNEEVERLNAEIERRKEERLTFEQALLKIRVAMGLDPHDHENLIEVAESQASQLTEARARIESLEQTILRLTNNAPDED